MLRCKDNCLGFSFPKTHVRVAHSAYQITLLSSKRYCNRVDLHEILFITIGTSEFRVLLDFNKLRCEVNCLSFSLNKTVVRGALLAF